MKKQVVFGIKNSKILVLLLILICSTGSATYLQFVKGDMVQNALKLNSPGLSKAIILFLIFMCLEVSMYYVEWRYETYILTDAFYRIKSKIFDNILKFDVRKKPLSGKDGTQLLTNSVDSLKFSYYYAWFDNIYLVCRVIFVFGSLLLINLYLAIVLAILMVTPLLFTQLFRKKIAGLNKNYMDQVGDNLHSYENYVTNLDQIHIFNVRKFIFKKMDQEIMKEQTLNRTVNNYQYLLNVSYSFISYLSSFAVLAFAMVLISQKQMTMGTAITLMGLVEQLSSPILSLSRNTSQINSTKSIRDDIAQAVEQASSPREPVNFDHTITTKNVTTNLDKKLVTYQDMTFEKGRSYAILGSSGIGKSVFLKVLTGLQKFANGEIWYDKEALGNAATKNTFNNLGFVEADNNLFNDTVINNIFLGRTPTEEELQYCSQLLSPKILQADDSTTLSSDETRRVLLLRGLMSRKSNLIFDEPTANLDKKTSRVFWQMLNNWFKKTRGTLIVVSHTLEQEELDKFDQVLDFNQLIKS